MQTLKLYIVILALFVTNILSAQTDSLQYQDKLLFHKMHQPMKVATSETTENVSAEIYVSKDYLIKSETQKNVTLDYLEIPLNITAESLSPMNEMMTTLFYGKTISLEIDKKIKYLTIKDISEEKITDFWRQMNLTADNLLLLQLLTYKTELNLSDWGYYMLITNIAEQIHSTNKNSANLFAWYFMLKSGFKTLLIYNNDNIANLIGAKDIIYGMSFLEADNQKYYYTEGYEIKDAKIYKYTYKEAEKLCSLSFDKNINLPENIQQTTIKFYHNNTPIEIAVKYNKNITDFYNDYPTTSLDIYFNTQFNHITKTSLKEGLQRFLDDKTEQEKTQFLLDLVQTAFEYATDNQQFKTQKYFFADQILTLAKCDDSDKAVFFANLIKEISDQDIMALIFENHITTALTFNEKIKGNYVIDDDKKYFVCDPTYKNAKIGEIPKSIKIQHAKIFNVKNNKINQLKNQIILLLNDKKIYVSSPNNIVFDKENNFYVSAYCNQNVTIDNKNIPHNNTKNDIFIAKFSKDNKLIWYDKIAGPKNESPIDIQIYQNKLYITGQSDSTLEHNNCKINDIQENNFFAAQYLTSGKIQWITAINATKSEDNSAFHTVIEKDGKIISTTYFQEIEYFDNYSIQIEDNYNCHIVCYFPNTTYTEEDPFFNATRTYIATKEGYTQTWQSFKDDLIALNYQKNVAEIYAMFNFIDADGKLIEGTRILDIVHFANSNFKNNMPLIYANLNELTLVKNEAGIIQVNTNSNKTIYFKDIIIDNGAKFTITSFKGGNSQINVQSGMFYTDQKCKINSIKINRISGDMTIDYGTDNSIKTINIVKDILN